MLFNLNKTENLSLILNFKKFKHKKRISIFNLVTKEYYFSEELKLDITVFNKGYIFGIKLKQKQILILYFKIYKKKDISLIKYLQGLKKAGLFISSIL